MSKACEKFKTPVTGGNVSFYNQSSYEGPVFPTPTSGMIGILEDKKFQTSLDFKAEGDLIYLIGESRNDISSSEYLYSFCKIKNSPAPYFDIEKEFSVQNSVRELIYTGLVQSAHDCSEGGLFIALLESAMNKQLGFMVRTDGAFRKDAFLFGESQSRVVMSIKKESAEKFESMLRQKQQSYLQLGEIKGESVVIDQINYGPVSEFSGRYSERIEKIMAQ
jgi:phosphoribosylformylglycinamidine synthase